MTRFFVDYKEIEPPPGTFSISQFLKHVDGAHLDENSAASQIRINGRPLDLDDGSRPARPGTCGNSERPDTVEVFTGGLEEMARTSIRESLAYVNRSDGVIHSLIRSLRDGSEVGSPDGLRHLYEGFYWVNRLLDRLEADFRIRPEGISMLAKAEPGYRGRCISTLKLLTEFRGKGDAGRAADLLERKIYPLVPVWREVLQAAMKKTCKPSEAVKSLSGERVE